MKSLFLIFVMAITFKARAQVNPVVDQVVASVNMRDYASAEKLINAVQARGGVSTTSALALSWMGRGALANRDFDRADKYAADTRGEAMALLKQRPLDAEPDLPLALGASIEVTAQSLAARGRRSEAVAFLQQEITAFHNTSIVL